VVKKSVLLILLVLLVDQAIKIYVKTHFIMGEEYKITPWFIIDFTENNGIAFGMFSGQQSKIFLSVFRIIAVFGIGWYLKYLITSKAHIGLVMSVALIFAGALGNIIDSAFYGMIFSDDCFNVGTMFPPGGGYAGFLHGKVVDMFYFPIVKGHFPSWFPIWGTEDFIFFRPVFNFSDSAITVGVLLIVFFQKKFYPQKPEENKAVNKESGETTQNI
jgi:signal peptidase II